MQLPPSGGGRPARHLLRLFRALGPDDRSTLVAFAEFLAARARQEETTAQAPLAPEPIPRPERETVVAAIKRLSRTYHMLDRSALLNETSSLMTSHILSGRDAQGVIDDIEAVFARHYDEYVQSQSRQGSGDGGSATPENVTGSRHERFPQSGPLTEGDGDRERAGRDFHGKDS
jgi:hypothetical protein